MIIEIPNKLAITKVDANSLRAGWRDFTDYAPCLAIGNSWYDEGGTTALQVPSAVLPNNFNHVINAIHPDFKKIVLQKTTELVPDARIEDLLKNYQKSKG